MFKLGSFNPRVGGSIGVAPPSTSTIFVVRVSLVALAVSVAPSLTVKTTTPNVNVDGLENPKVNTTIINT